MPKGLKNDPFFRNNPETKSLEIYFNLPNGKVNGPTYYNVLIPNFCPFENLPTHFNFVANTNVIHLGNDEEHIGMVYQCPSCYKYCVIDYLIVNITDTEVYPYNYGFNHPNLLFSMKDFKTLSLISPKFKNIYIQAAKADFEGLSHIYIMGYRKALEFLISDYLIKFNICKKSEIKCKTLGKQINKINNGDMKSLARVASYIGNDHTHVFNNDPELTGEDMKECLDAFAHFVIYKVDASDSRRFLDK